MKGQILSMTAGFSGFQISDTFPHLVVGFVTKCLWDDIPRSI